MAIALCAGLMTGLTVITWLRFVVWLALGLVIYALYGWRHSGLHRKPTG
jgi:APA family basic amino acid/polyamine antiporter